MGIGTLEVLLRVLLGWFIVLTVFVSEFNKITVDQDLILNDT